MTSLLRFIGQLIILFLSTTFCILLIEMKLPGHGSFTNQDGGIIFFIGILCLFTTLGLIINTILFLEKNHWKPFRKVILTWTACLSILVLTPSKVFSFVLMGIVDQSFSLALNESDRSAVYATIQLYYNGEFLSETFDGSYNRENIGHYNISKDTVTLNFENDDTKILGTKFLLSNDTLRCLNCSGKIILVKD